MDLIERLKYGYKQGSVFTKLIYINIAIFLVAKVLLAALNRFTDGGWILYLELPSRFSSFLSQPWSVITYMFLHQDFMHLFGNMIMLYFFGKMTLYFLDKQQAIGVYLLGGIGGAVFYLLSYNLLLENYITIYLLGASAACYSLLAASAAIKPGYSFNLLFLGEIRLKWIAITFFAIVCFNLLTDGSNMGGDIAHIGGFAFGYIYGALYSKGKDILKPFIVFANRIGTLFLQKNKNNDNGSRRQYHFQKGSPVKTDAEYNVEQKKRQKEIDIILDKIKKYGYDSLSKEEKETLFKS